MGGEYLSLAFQMMKSVWWRCRFPKNSFGEALGKQVALQGK
jgi:hypothetical protein